MRPLRPLRARLAVAIAGLAAVALPGCGVGSLQTAKTTPKGGVNLTFGGGYLHNRNVGKRGVVAGNFPGSLAARYGVLERLEVGLEVFALGGALAGVKVNLMPPAHPLAVAVRVDLGGAADVFGDSPEAWALHLRIMALLSYEIRGRVSPYAGVGYGFFWIYGRSPTMPAEPGLEYADREGYGDGVLMVNAGLEVRVHPRLWLLVEYNFWKAVVDDPGDFYAFVDNHIVLAGMRVHIGRRR